MAIVHQYDKRHDVTYVYYSESYYDKSKKQSRAKRTLIGRLDPKTNEIVPVRKSTRSKPLPDDIQKLLENKEKQTTDSSVPNADQLSILKAQVFNLQQQLDNEKRNTQREHEKTLTLISKLNHILDSYK